MVSSMPSESRTYTAEGFCDELVDAAGMPRPHARKLLDYFLSMDPQELVDRQHAVNRTIADMGISFTIYSEGDNIDRAWPLDAIPRAMSGREWDRIEAGLVQRLRALNMFIDDLYNDRSILKDKVVPADIIDSSRNYLDPCKGVHPRYGVWAHICGTDLVRGGDGEVYVLEDNLRVPSGVSYMLENRDVIKRVFPSLFRDLNIRPVSEYPTQLSAMLCSLVPADWSGSAPEVVVLTPGIYNSAYFEHSYLARTMGVELVEGGDLVVGDDDRVYMRSIGGLVPIDVIYRRIDDVFMDPEVFRPDSMLGVPGIMRAWRAGNVALANAPGSGVADDKVVYSYVPEIIRFYLAEEPIIPNVPTWRCSDPQELDHVLARLPELVVKPANESGGYGMLVGPHATRAEHEEFRRLLKANPRNYIAQPTLSLSTAPTLIGDTLEPRHLDLRPFILQGREFSVTAGGLTRVAMQKGSLVVNSSQGGGSKDTWIVEDTA
jgi:uncharacterized circularly permuted ATP-grasp superfamily protein